jgi:hypothetical protein
MIGDDALDHGGGRAMDSGEAILTIQEKYNESIQLLAEVLSGGKMHWPPRIKL